MERSAAEEVRDLEALGRRCVALYQHPAVQGKGWMPRLFWRPNPADPRDPFGSLRVDPLELEVLFATIAGEASLCHAALETRQPGRAGFIARSIRHGELPLLTFYAPQ
ncbi:MAG: hypothetical protein ACOY4L_04455 [Pseudomonadota bacterium]